MSQAQQDALRRYSEFSDDADDADDDNPEKSSPAQQIDPATPKARGKGRAPAHRPAKPALPVSCVRILAGISRVGAGLRR